MNKCNSSVGSLTVSTSDSSLSSHHQPFNNTQRNNVKQTGKRGAHGRGKNKLISKEVTFTSEEEQEHYVAIDCEMVGCGLYGAQSILARVTIVDWNNQILFDTYVKPTNSVTDYRTHVSGITSYHLNGPDAIELDVCRQIVLHTIQNKIVIGHALENDLDVLGITHPWYLIRDTATYEAFMQIRFEDGTLWPRRLKHLVKENLHREIQLYGKPHSAFEDSVAALDLYKLVRTNWENTMMCKFNETMKMQNWEETPI